MAMHTNQSVDRTPRVKRGAQSVSNPDSPNYDPDSPDYDESLDDSRGNSVHLKRRPKNRGAIGTDTPEVGETLSPESVTDDTESDSETFAPPRALGFGGSMASAREVTNGILAGKK